MKLVRAYGKKLRSREEALSAWNSGKDFIASFRGAPFGQLVNKQDVETYLTVPCVYIEYTGGKVKVDVVR